MKLSIIIPAYNETKNLKRGSLDEVENYLKRQTFDWEVIIVDDGSTDGTVKLIQTSIKDKLNFKLIQNPHGGKAITVMSGLIASKGEIAVFTDMDQATPISEIEKFFPKFDEGFDVVIGSRHGRSGAPFMRKLSAWGFSLLRNIILGLPFSDTQCGFKAFKKEAISIIFPPMLEKWQSLKSKGAAVNAGFDIEALFLAKKKKLKIVEVPVNWHYVGSERIQLISDSIEAIRDMLRIRLNDFKGVYD